MTDKDIQILKFKFIDFQQLTETFVFHGVTVTSINCFFILSHLEI